MTENYKAFLRLSNSYPSKPYVPKPKIVQVSPTPVPPPPNLPKQPTNDGRWKKTLLSIVVGVTLTGVIISIMEIRNNWLEKRSRKHK